MFYKAIKDNRESYAIEDATIPPIKSMDKVTSSKPEMFKKITFNNIADTLNQDLNLRIKGEKAPTKKAASEDDYYEFNGGTSLAIVVDNKIIIASDTRHSAEYNINSRDMSKIFRIGKFFLSTTGFYADSFEVYTKMMYEIKQYEAYRPITVKAAAHLLMNILYSKRFFPHYSYICLSGFEDGEAKIYSFDCIGSYQEVKCRCDGSGSVMIQPLLDSWISGKNFENFQPLGFEAALMLVKKAFDATAERDVKTKDNLEIYVVSEDEVHHEYVPLRKD